VDIYVHLLQWVQLPNRQTEIRGHRQHRKRTMFSSRQRKDVIYISTAVKVEVENHPTSEAAFNSLKPEEILLSQEQIAATSTNAATKQRAGIGTLQQNLLNASLCSAVLLRLPKVVEQLLERGADARIALRMPSILPEESGELYTLLVGYSSQQNNLSTREKSL
jgi:hypothetical protein